VKKVTVIARNTFREAIRDRILYLILVFAVLVIVTTKALGWISVEHDQQIILDLSLLAISLFCVIIAVFVGTGLIYKEMDKRTIYTILSKPVDRWQFVLGKYLGLAFTVCLIAFLMELFLLGYLAVLGYLPEEANVRRMLLYSLLLIHGEILITTAVAIALSLVTSPVLSAVLTLVIWLAGNASQEIMNLSGTMANLAADSGSAMFGALEWITRGIYCITPHLNYFSEFKAYAVWPDPAKLAEITALAVGGRLLYAVAYTVLLLCLSVLIFRRRSF
jgi:ABC-type transport system involved in multi-copper enzyme maturation permease subunit